MNAKQDHAEGVIRKKNLDKLLFSIIYVVLSKKAITLLICRVNPSKKEIVDKP